MKLLGITPSGLNASSDGEIRVFYDSIRAAQEQMFQDPLQKVIDILQLHLFGDIDPNVGFVFNPLWQLDEAAQSSVRKTDADTDAVYVELGVLAPEEVRTRLADSEDSPYAGLDPDDMPEQPELAEEPSTGGDPAKSAEPRGEERSGM